MITSESWFSENKLILATVLMSWRVFWGIFARTSFVPDEYYQVVEAGFHWVSRKGIISTWEWDSEFQIRSFVSILPFIATFNFIIKLDSVFFQAVCPRLIQSALAFISDIFLFDLVSVLQGHKVAQVVAAVHCLSWSATYCLCRTLANSTETCLVIIGSSLLLTSPYKGNNRGIYRFSSVVVACISVYCRPTSLLFWAPLFLGKMLTDKGFMLAAFKQYLPLSVFIVEVCILIDCFYYGTFTVPPLNFYTANITLNMASLFGVQPWYWSFTQGLPVMLGLYTPLLLYGLRYCLHLCPPTVQWLVVLSVGYVVGLGLISPHQEIRFLLPALPFLHILVGNAVVKLTGCNSALKRDSNRARKFTVGRLVCGLIAVVHFAGIVYLLRYHQSGTEAALLHVAEDMRVSTAVYRVESVSSEPTMVHVLAPCYSFPGYSFIHTEKYPVVLNTLSCDPRNRTNAFDSDPLYHLKHMVSEGSGNGVSGLSYVLTFDAYLPLLRVPLEELGYDEIKTIRHAYFRYDYDDSFPKQMVHIFRRRPAKRER